MDITLDPGGTHSPECTAAVANAIPEAVRVLNHATIDRRNGALVYPADADAVIAALATAMQRLPQCSTNSASGSQTSSGPGGCGSLTACMPGILVRTRWKPASDRAKPRPSRDSCMRR